MSYNEMDGKILRLAIPNIVSNVSIPLLSTVDTILMGRLSLIHLAAIGVGSMIFNMIYWNFGFLRMGTTGAVAQSYGANDDKEITVLLIRGVLLGLVIAAILIFSGSAILSLSKDFYHVTNDAYGHVSGYFNIRIWAAPATLILYVLFGWLFGMQNAVYPLYITIFINVLNIIVSYYCVEFLHLEANGVAMGTVAAQYMGMFLAFGLIFFKYRLEFDRISSEMIFNILELKKYFSINSDIFTRTLCLTFVFSFFYSQSFKLGAMVIAVNVILQQFVNWMSYIIDGFAYASESLVGKYVGRNDEQATRSVIFKSFIWGGGVAVLCTLIFYFFGDPLIHQFSNDDLVIIEAKNMFYFVWIFPILGFTSYIWDGIYVGLLASKSMRNSMVLSLFVFLISFYLLPTDVTGRSIWIALCLFMIARGLFQTIIFLKNGTKIE